MPSLIISAIWGLIMTKIYTKIVDICGDNILEAILFMGLAEITVYFLYLKAMTFFIV